MAIIFIAAHPTFADNEESTSPLSVLHFYTTSYLNEGEQGLGVTLEVSRMRVDDAVVDEMPQSQSQPKLTTPGGLLNVVDRNGVGVIQHPAGAPPAFPILASTQVDMTEERHSWLI